MRILLVLFSNEDCLREIHSVFYSGTMGKYLHRGKIIQGRNYIYLTTLSVANVIRSRW